MSVCVPEGDTQTWPGRQVGLEEGTSSAAWAGMYWTVAGCAQPVPRYLAQHIVGRGTSCKPWWQVGTLEYQLKTRFTGVRFCLGTKGAKLPGRNAPEPLLGTGCPGRALGLRVGRRQRWRVPHPQLDGARPRDGTRWQWLGLQVAGRAAGPAQQRGSRARPAGGV